MVTIQEPFTINGKPAILAGIAINLGVINLDKNVLFEVPLIYKETQIGMAFIEKDSKKGKYFAIPYNIKFDLKEVRDANNMYIFRENKLIIEKRRATNETN